MRLFCFFFTALACSSAVAQPSLTPDEIEAVTYPGGDLPEDLSALTVKVQVLLDRTGISPGVIDGRKGGMSTTAILAFEVSEGLWADGVLDPAVWAALGGDTAAPILLEYTITADDLAAVRGEPLPQDYTELAELEILGYERSTEALAERFHMDEDFLIALNSDAAFAEGETITVVNPGESLDLDVRYIRVLKRLSRLSAYNTAGRLVANYPVTIGSDAMPSPEGTVSVVAIAPDPTYHYDPEVNFQQGENTEPLVLPPGPNGPVGSVWIDLSRPTYGLHGTPEPSVLFQKSSHGCVRLTNWDAEELAALVHEGTVVEFME